MTPDEARRRILLALKRHDDTRAAEAKKLDGRKVIPMDEWREKLDDFQGCDKHDGMFYNCEHCCAAAIGERNRLARFARKLSGAILNIPMTSDIEGLLASLWKESAK